MAKRRNGDTNEISSESLRLARLRLGAAGRTVALFLVFGLLWIVVTTFAGEILFRDMKSLTAFELIKGILFVVLSALIIYFSIALHANRVLRSEIRSIEKLKQSERTFQTLVNGIDDHLMALLGPDGRIRTWNPGAEMITGHQARDVIGESFEILFPDQGRAAGQARALLESARESGRVNSVDQRLRRDGSRFWTESTISAICNDAGEVISFAKVSRDLTETIEYQTRLERRTLQHGLIAELGTKALSTPSFLPVFRSEISRIGRGADADSAILLSRGGDGIDSIRAEWHRGSGPRGDGEQLLRALRALVAECEPFSVASRSSLDDFQVLADSGYVSGTAVHFTIGDSSWCLGVLYRREFVFAEDDAHYFAAIARIVANGVERSERERKIIDRETKMRLLLEQLPTIVWTADENLIITSSMGSGLRELGISANQSVGRHVSDVVPKEIVGTIQEALDGTAGEYRIDVEGQILRTLVAPLRSPDGTIEGVAGVSVDVTEDEKRQKEIAEKTLALENLSMRILDAQEAERGRIARELHDEFGGTFTSMKFDTSWIIENTTDPDIAMKAGQMGERIDAAMRTVRRTARELRPKVIDDFGLVPAIEDYLNDFTDRYHIDADFSAVPEDLTVRRGTDIIIYRVIQEALTNVARHAEATRVEIRVRHDDSMIKVEIRDNGIGISQESVIAPDSLGLLGMRERVEMIGGRLTIESFPGKGTIVRISVPIEESDR